MVGFISGGDQSAYRGEVEHLMVWCRENNLLLDTAKNKELVVDFRKKKTYNTLLNIGGDCVKILSDFCFLGVQMKENLTWCPNTCAGQKGPAELFPWKAFYSIVYVYGTAAAQLPRIKTSKGLSKLASVSGWLLPTLEELHSTCCLRRA